VNNVISVIKQAREEVKVQEEETKVSIRDASALRGGSNSRNAKMAATMSFNMHSMKNKLAEMHE
jgi:hypothetical protein